MVIDKETFHAERYLAVLQYTQLMNGKFKQFAAPQRIGFRLMTGAARCRRVSQLEVQASPTLDKAAWRSLSTL